MTKQYYVYQRADVKTGKVSNVRYGADHQIKIGTTFTAGGKQYKVISCRPMKNGEIGIRWI